MVPDRLGRSDRRGQQGVLARPGRLAQPEIKALSARQVMQAQLVLLEHRERPVAQVRLAQQGLRERKVRLAAVGLSAQPGPLDLKEPQVHRAPPEARGLLVLLDPSELPGASGRPEPLARQEQDRRRMCCR
jgi:hypothetical protein